MVFKDMKKVELHCHLEGVVRFPDAVEGFKKLGFPDFPQDEKAQREYLLLLEPQKTLFDFLAVLDRCQPLVNNLVFLKETARKMVIEKYQEGVRVLEMRFSPTYVDMNDNLDWDEVLFAVEEGIVAGKEECNNEIEVGIIIIAVGAAPRRFFEKSVDFCIKHQSRIIGFDIAGVEQNLSSFGDLMDRIHAAGINITCHAAEDMVTGKPENVMYAAQLLHARRIGHGIQIFRVPEIMEFVKERNIHLEVNPISNLFTGAVEHLREHPIRKLFDAGVSVSISSDDPGLVDLYLVDDYRAVVEHLEFKYDELVLCNINGLCHSFLPDEVIKTQISKFFLDDIKLCHKSTIDRIRSLLSLHKRLPADFPPETINIQPALVQASLSSESITAM